MDGQIFEATMPNNSIALWQPEAGGLIPASAKSVTAIAQYAQQLSVRDKKQIAAAFSAGHYEMGLNYLWARTINALKKELSSVGVTLLGEMLGRADVDEDDDIDDLLTTKDAIRLAGELGVVSATDALRLQHTYELITHFSQLDVLAADIEDIDESEAIASLKACIKAVLGRPKVEVAKKFIEFRSALESESLPKGDPRVSMLRSSPYFFLKLTVNVLMNAAKRNAGAQLENALANANTLIPEVWEQLRDTERWYVGQTYAEAYSNGRSTAVGGLKKALLKVRGFDYVPENLRSDTFVKSAEAVIRAHEGLNNFYNEAAPVSNLARLGTTIPPPAIPACVTALLCVVLGNRYGVAWAALAEARSMLDSLSDDRWAYYINQVLPSDVRILSKLTEERPRSNWISLMSHSNISPTAIKDRTIGKLIANTKSNNSAKVGEAAADLLKKFYG